MKTEQNTFDRFYNIPISAILRCKPVSYSGLERTEVAPEHEMPEGRLNARNG